MASKSKYKLVRRDGITAIVLFKKKALLLKRRNVPVISNPGIWAFVSGATESGESHISTAYREIEEETGIKKDSLKLVKEYKLLLFEERKRIMWPNQVFIFNSNTWKVKLDWENSDYRWATIDEIVREKRYTNIFINKQLIIKSIRDVAYGKIGNEKKA